MVWVRNVFLKYGLGAKRLSEIWFGCELNVFLKYGLGAKRLSEIWFGAKRLPELWRRGRNVFLIYGEGAKRLS